MMKNNIPTKKKEKKVPINTKSTNLNGDIIDKSGWVQLRLDFSEPAANHNPD